MVNKEWYNDMNQHNNAISEKVVIPLEELYIGQKVIIFGKKTDNADDLFKLKGKKGIVDCMGNDNTPDCVILNNEEAILLKDYEVMNNSKDSDLEDFIN